MIIARVAIPRPNVERTWDYLVPSDLADSVSIGIRVQIPVGKGTATGYITELDSQPHTSRSLKAINEVLDDSPLVLPEILDLTRWAADYYLSPWGEIIKAALPAGINIDEKETLRISESGRTYLENILSRDLIPEEEGEAFKLLDHLRVNGPERAAELEKRATAGLLSKLLGQGMIARHTSRTGGHLEKKRLAVEAVSEPPSVPDSFWKRSPKRVTAWEQLQKKKEPVLLANSEEELGVSPAIVKGLAEAGLARIFEMEVRRDPFRFLDVEHCDPHPLTDSQLSVHDTVAKTITKNKFGAFLLHGVTGSGKTEVYLHLVERCLEQGKTALVLIPELSLTPQFVRRYYAVFGDDLAILHSGLARGERTDEWLRVLRGDAKVVLGTRLSIFAPLKNLGLIVVDEEHDQSYRQDDYPSFNARDLAVVRASQCNAACLMGSATPSLESLHNADNGKYELLELKSRVFERPLPNIDLVDLRMPENKPDESLLPPKVRDAIGETLRRSEQTLVMVGRKGYAPFVLCRACGHSFECNNCSISMAWHEKIDKLKCHYCGKISTLPQICPECGSTSIEALGTGSAKVEEQLQATFPDARVARMDRDVVTKHRQYNEILGKLRDREIDILVGTQMLAKGHDYPDVTTVVAMGLDGILSLPDFRHAERLFQLIIQISGRAGRGERPGNVFILSYRPGHYAIGSAAQMNFKRFLEKELKYRLSLRYPPFGFLAMIILEDFNRERGMAAAQGISERLHALLEGGAYILGPALAPYAKLKNRWRQQIFIKAPDRNALNTALHAIRKEFSGPARLKISIDPVSVM